MADVPDDALMVMLAKLSPGALLSVSTVSRRFALAAEPTFKQACREHHWVQPRMPRGAAAVTRHFPWRSLYRQHACRACGNLGEFPVRRSHAGSLKFLLCKGCLGLDWVQKRLQAAEGQAGLCVDLVGITGKRLLRKLPKKRNRGPGQGAANV
ncbi:hypothetical protein WJX72_005849 [[Myrmecia] bisecta]|uniref:F-box domain-containing protein n=1 Tax=[Myrmecia] bisecta TaxID=41462 RepID=A0AAW1R7C8_9CHLO